MPVYGPGDTYPDWCAIRSIEEFSLDPTGESFARKRRIEPEPHLRSLVLVAGGGVEARSEYGVTEMRRRSWLHVPASGLDLDAAGGTTVDDHAQLILVRGTWEGTPLVGLFRSAADRPLEMHFHDFDEYWYMLHGHSDGFNEGDRYEIGPGSLVATPEGFEHGIPEPRETLVGMSFELEPRPGARHGHLHRGVHGEPKTRWAATV